MKKSRKISLLWVISLCIIICLGALVTHHFFPTNPYNIKSKDVMDAYYSFYKNHVEKGPIVIDTLGITDNYNDVIVEAYQIKLVDTFAVILPRKGFTYHPNYFNGKIISNKQYCRLTYIEERHAEGVMTIFQTVIIGVIYDSVYNQLYVLKIDPHARRAKSSRAYDAWKKNPELQYFKIHHPDSLKFLKEL